MKHLFNHTNEETALAVENYPYGFRLRTTIRYWIETTKHGERFCSQTVNPKTGRWNKPKKSTYSQIGIMTELDNGHISWDGFGAAYTAPPDLGKFLAEVGEENLTEYQTNEVRRCRAVYETRKHITVTVGGPARSPEEQDKTRRGIARLFAHNAIKEGYNPGR